MSQKVELRITLDENGRMGVQGPIDNLAFCYGLLEMAKDAIRDRHMQARQRQQGPRIVVPEMQVGFRRPPNGGRGG